LQAYSNIESSWNNEWKRYEAEIKVARWENCREQGYIVSLKHKRDQLNIVFYEHRNSDAICAVKWEQYSFDNLTIHNAMFGDICKDRYDISHSVNYGKAYLMAEWVYRQFELFWNEKTKNEN